MRFSKLLTYHLLLLSLAGVGCSDVFDVADSSSGADDGENSVYLRLILNNNKTTSTRAADDAVYGNPYGGEDGDGREPAVPREYRIYDLNIFIYSLAGGNALNYVYPETVSIKKQLYVDGISNEGLINEDEDGKIDVIFDDIIRVTGYEPGPNDYVLVMANLGKPVDDTYNIAALQHMSFDSTWQGDVTNEISHFTMATARTGTGLSAYEGKIDTKDTNGDKVDPFKVETTIERTAARIDFWHDAENESLDGDVVESFKYDVFDSLTESDTGADVVITHIVPVNVMVPGSYAFKHVTGSFADMSIKICGDETHESGMPTNYVLAPLTKDKQGKTLEYMFGNSRLATAKTAIKDADENSPYRVKSLLGNSNFGFTGGEEFGKYHILCYANENTHIGKNFDTNYLTGLAFKALYVPSVVYSGADDDGKLIMDESWSKGKDFWRFAPAHDGSGSGKDVGESYCKYFSSLEAANAYKAANPEMNGIITNYPGGVCYYNLWIKHANYASDNNPDPQEMFEMQYGIVRNNIYRVGVSFSGPGDSEPTMNGPVNMRPKIFVRKWNLRDEKEIIF